MIRLLRKRTFQGREVCLNGVFNSQGYLLKKKTFPERSVTELRLLWNSFDDGRRGQTVCHGPLFDRDPHKQVYGFS